jgi:hypothetical protein
MLIDINTKGNIYLAGCAFKKGKLRLFEINFC